jgi:cytochrome P450
MSEAMAHLLMVLAEHREIQGRLARHPQDEPLLDHVMAETLRLYPLFGISHRITSADIAIGPRQAIPRGTVLCFNYPDYHRAGFEDAGRFDPDRWNGASVRDANYIPFGVTGNRPCPAQNLALNTMRAATRQLLQHFTFLSSASHTRSLPSRGPCLLVRAGHRLDSRRRDALLLFIRLRDRAEDVWRSMVQLVLGTYMVWDARRQRLCERHFETAGSSGDRPASGPHAGGICPIR